MKHSADHFVRKLESGLKVHTNTAESFFSLLKRGHYGVYHRMSRKHLPRYCFEFNFRWNHRKVTDGERLTAAIKGAEGKRLMYRVPKGSKLKMARHLVEPSLEAQVEQIVEPKLEPPPF